MSFALEILEKIEAILLNKADKDVLSYSIGGRTLSKYSFAELVELRDKFKAEVQKEKLAKDLKKKGVSRIKGVRYV